MVTSRIRLSLWAGAFLWVAGCPGAESPGVGWDPGPELAVDTGLGDSLTDAPPVDGGPAPDGAVDSGPDAGGPAGYPNISQALGYPWTAGPAPVVNAQWQSACADELPANAAPSLPPMPATPDNCAGDPTKCGAGESQDCSAAPAVGRWLHRATVDTALFPDAVCNDGSPGVLEIRPGTGDGADTWLIWFKGGSSCRDQHTCARRWCGNQSGTTYAAHLMSTDWNGDGLVDRPYCARATAGSAMDPNLAGNPFANVNVVKIWYCGSDNHIGRGTVDYDDDDLDGDAVERGFSTEVKGRRIVEAMLELLSTGLTSDDGAVTLPSLDDASRVVISGSSAGSLGAMQNLDAMAEFITAAAPTAQVRGVLDANVPPSAAVVDSYPVYVDVALDEMQTPGERLGELRHSGAATSWTGWYRAADAFVDQSCVAHVQATQGDAGMAACLLPAELLLAKDAGAPLLSTPSFVRFDLGDGVIGGIYNPCRDRVTGAPCYSPNHSMLSYEQTDPVSWLELLDSSDHNRATLISIIEGDTAVTGVFAPACESHTGFANSNFSTQMAEDYDGGGFSGSPMTFMQALGTWLVSGAPLRVIDSSKSSPDAPSSTCGGTEG